jgi:hypothetical protein
MGSTNRPSQILFLLFRRSGFYRVGDDNILDDANILDIGGLGRANRLKLLSLRWPGLVGDRDSRWSYRTLLKRHTSRRIEQLCIRYRRQVDVRIHPALSVNSAGNNREKV